MKRDARLFSPLVLILIAALQCVGIQQVIAADKESGDLIRNLHNLRIQSYFAINAYYNFSAAQGDKALLADINEASAEVQTLLDATVALPAAKNYAKQLGQIKTEWKTLGQQLKMNIGDILKTGFPDLRLVDDMARQNQTFNQLILELDDKAKTELGVTLPDRIAKIRESAISLSLMMTKYSARSTSNVSQIFQGSMNDKGIDVIAAEYEASFAIVKAAATGNPKAEKIVTSILAKWNFIRGSYINYNENNVNYVVNLYSTRIILALLELEGVLDA